MNVKSFIFAASIIFLLVALLQLARIVFQWDIIIDQWHLPIWASVIAVLVTGFMSFLGFHSLQQIHKHLT